MVSETVRGSVDDRLVESVDEVDDRLFAEWTALADQVGSPYASPAWCLGWMRQSGRQPVICICRTDGRLVGALPLVRDGKTLRFPEQRAGDDFRPMIAPDEDHDAVLARIAALLATTSRPWNTIAVREQRSDKEWVDAFAAALPGAYSVVARPSDERATIQLSGGTTWDSYMAGLKRGVRKETRRRRLEEAADATTVCVEGGAELDEALRALFGLHDSRWDERGGSDVRSDERTVTEQLVRDAASRGRLRLWIMTIDGKAAAGELAFVYESRQVHFMSGFDPQYANRGIGIVLMSYAIERAIEEEVSEIDLGPGASGYKRDYRTGLIDVRHTVVVPSRHPIRLALAAAYAGRTRLIHALSEERTEWARDLKRRARSLRAGRNT